GAPKLGMLVRQILKHVPELKRLRLSSIDSVEADSELLDLIAGEARLMPHLHLSLQAGDDLILKRMKRRHSRAQAIAFCRTLRRHLEREVGTTHRILAESGYAGRTEHFTAVRFAAPVEPGSIVERTIAGHDGGQLLAA